MEMRIDDPRDRLLPMLGAQNGIVQYMRALPHQEVAAAVEAARTSDSAAPAARLASKFLLTAARSTEARLATWDEMDEAGRVWTISAERMKAKREHRIPLLGRAVEILVSRISSSFAVDPERRDADQPVSTGQDAPDACSLLQVNFGRRTLEAARSLGARRFRRRQDARRVGLGLTAAGARTRRSFLVVQRLGFRRYALFGLCILYTVR